MARIHRTVQKYFHDPDNHDGVITHLEPDVPECEVKMVTADGDCSHELKLCLLLGRKVMTNLDIILKSRDITLPTKVRLVRLWFFQ